MKNNKGVTTMQIVITVIVMLILLSIAIFYSRGTTKEATLAVLYNEIRDVTSAVQEASVLNQIKVSGEEIIFFGETSAPKVEKSAYSSQLANAGEGEFYFLDFTTSKDLKHTLELENVKNDYILNYNTLKLYLKDGINLTDDAGNEDLKYSAEEIIYYYKNVFDYSESPKGSYLITYNTNGGNGEIANQSAPIGISITITSQRPTREGYAFMGWANSSGETNATYLPGSIHSFSENTTLYAVWKESNFDATVIMNGYQYGGTKTAPRIDGETNGGIVTYYYNTIDSNQNGTLWSEVTTSTSLDAGTYYMYATVLKDGVTSATPTTAFTISKANGSINYIDKTITKSLNDDSFRNILNQDGDGKVTYTSSDTSVATVASSGIVTIVGGGKTTITAEVEDSTNYTYATKTTSYELTVTKSNLSATVNMEDYVYAGKISQPSVTGNLESGEVKYYYSDTAQNSNGLIWNDMTSKSLNAGTYFMYAVISETANYGEFTTQPVGFTVEKAEGILKFEETTVEKKTNSDAFTNKLTNIGDGTIRYSSSNTDVATIDTNGEVTIQGEGEAIILATVSGARNYKYEITTVTYTLKVEQAMAYLMERDSDKMDYVLGYGRTGCTSEAYKASSIKTITLENTKTIPSNYVTSWDVSANEDGTIKAYLVPNGEMYDLRIITYTGKKEKIIAPESSYLLFSDYTECTEITGLNLLDTSKVTTMSCMFKDNFKLTSLDLSSFDTKNVAIMFNMFAMCEKLANLKISNFDTTKVINMTNMFLDCSSLSNLDLSSWNTSSVTEMEQMFALCTSLKTLNVSNWDVSNVTTMKNMFYSCSSLTELDLSSFVPSKVTSMSAMFYKCNSLDNLDVSKFEMKNVTTINSMFAYCNSLKKLDVSNWNVSDVTNMGSIFAHCSSLESLNVSKWNTSNVTAMNTIFRGCSNLKKLDVSNWNTSKATNMRYMFADCSNLENLDVTNFKTDNVTEMQYMFEGCSKLTTLNVSNFKTNNVTDMEGMFSKCSALSSLDLSSFNTSQVTSMASMFWECSSLTNLDLSNFDTRNVAKMNNMFVYCYNLSSLKLGEYFDRLIGENTFALDSNLKTIITLKTEPMELATEISLSSYCTLYVPNKEAERDFESGENYYEVFGTSVYNQTRDDGTLDLYYIRTIMELVGDETTYVEIGSSYTEQGVTVAGMNANEDGTYTPFGYTVSTSIKNRSGNVVDEIDTSRAGTYTITYKLLDANGKETGAETSRTVKVTMIHSVANGPILNTSQMKAVYWNESGEELETTSFELAQTEEGTIYNTTLYKYDYSFDDDIYELGTDTYDVEWALKPRWANAKTIEDGSYWVWIPRYAYKITYYTDNTKATVSESKTQYGSIDVIFLYETSNTQFKDKTGAIRTLPDGYKVHPAFQAMSQAEATEGNRLGKWNEELTGIWVAKYEASQEVSENGTSWTTRNVESAEEGNILTTNAGNKENVRVVSKPSVNSWREIKIANAYVNCLNMNTSLNTHQMKNSEWGAVAYLTYSVYGRNGNELAVNQCSGYYTGAGPGKGDSKIYNSTYAYNVSTFSGDYAYNTSQGKLASTTGNIYGVYDMSGGAFEYTASYVNNGHENLIKCGNDTDNSGYNLVDNNNIDIDILKTKQIYLSTATSGEDTQEVDYNLCKNTNGNLLVYGDAVYETSEGRNWSGWCSDYAFFPSSDNPFFFRGGNCNNENNAGVFYFYSDDGYYYRSNGFRPVICITSSK